MKANCESGRKKNQETNVRNLSFSCFSLISIFSVSISYVLKEKHLTMSALEQKQFKIGLSCTIVVARVFQLNLYGSESPRDLFQAFCTLSLSHTESLSGVCSGGRGYKEFQLISPLSWRWKTRDCDLCLKSQHAGRLRQGGGGGWVGLELRSASRNSRILS